MVGNSDIISAIIQEGCALDRQDKVQLLSNVQCMCVCETQGADIPDEIINCHDLTDHESVSGKINDHESLIKLVLWTPAVMRKVVINVEIEYFMQCCQTHRK